MPKVCTHIIQQAAWIFELEPQPMIGVSQKYPYPMPKYILHMNMIIESHTSTQFYFAQWSVTYIKTSALHTYGYFKCNDKKHSETQKLKWSMQVELAHFPVSHKTNA